MKEITALMLLKKFKEKYHFSDSKIAKGLHVDPTSVWKWLSGRSTPGSMAESAIMKYLKDRVGNKNWSPAAEESVRIKQEARAFAGLRSVRKSLSYEDRLKEEKDRLEGIEQGLDSLTEKDKGIDKLYEDEK